jgi:hypothetical protein
MDVAKVNECDRDFSRIMCDDPVISQRTLGTLHFAIEQDSSDSTQRLDYVEAYSQSSADRINSNDEHFCGGQRLSTSTQFHLSKPQKLSGTFLDPSGAVIPGIEVQLVSGKKVVRRVRTDNQGTWDFGEVFSGNYRMRVQSSPKDAFCAPEVRCTAQECTINTVLKPNPKNMVLVE